MQIDIMSFTRRGIELSAKIRECLYSCGKGTKCVCIQSMADIRKYQMQRYRLSGSGNTIVPMAKIRFMSKKASTTGCARVSNKTEMGKDSSHLDRRMRNRGARHGTFSA